jgi:opacity protein-like surface antigen
MFRATVFAGATAAAALGNSAPAFSADIAVEPEPVAESNWYISLHGGWKFGEDWDDHASRSFHDVPCGMMRTLAVPIITCDIDVDVDAKAETDDGFRVGGAIGWQLFPMFAIEAELGFMKQDVDTVDIGDVDINIVPSEGLSQEISFNCHDVLDGHCKQELDGDVSIVTLMGNAIFRLPLDSSFFSPYIGVGVGGAWVSFNDIGFDNFDACCLDDTDTSLALQAFAGVDFKVADHIALGVRGRILHIGDVDVVDDADFHHELDPDLIKSVEAVLTFGF